MLHPQLLLTCGNTFRRLPRVAVDSRRLADSERAVTGLGFRPDSDRRGSRASARNPVRPSPSGLSGCNEPADSPNEAELAAAAFWPATTAGSWTPTAISGPTSNV